MIMAFRIPRFLTAGAAALLLCGCLAKEKSGKAMGSGGMTPPWDPAKFSPKRLEGYAYPGPESTLAKFAVFAEIARVDSAAGDPKDWNLDPDAVDTLGLANILDTAFSLPPNPEASMPYGYDDSFRDDTLFRNAYGNGLFTQDHPCAVTYVLSGQFPHPAKWVRPGLKGQDIVAALGKPAYSQQGALRYLSRRSAAAAAPASGDTSNPATAAAFEEYQGINFYFKADSLFAAVLQKSRPCH